MMMTSCLERMVLNNNPVRTVGTMMMRVSAWALVMATLMTPGFGAHEAAACEPEELTELKWPEDGTLPSNGSPVLRTSTPSIESFTVTVDGEPVEFTGSILGRRDDIDFVMLTPTEPWPVGSTVQIAAAEDTFSPEFDVTLTVTPEEAAEDFSEVNISFAIEDIVSENFSFCDGGPSPGDFLYHVSANTTNPSFMILSREDGIGGDAHFGTSLSTRSIVSNSVSNRRSDPPCVEVTLMSPLDRVQVKSSICDPNRCFRRDPRTRDAVDIDCDALDDPEEGTGCAQASTARAPSAPEGLPWLLMLGAMCAIGVARRKRPRRV